jgi:hypothetical protein
MRRIIILILLSFITYLQVFAALQPTVINNGTRFVIAQIDVTQAPYNADKSGVADSKNAIQKAIDDVTANNGCGLVYLPAGKYRLTGPLSLKRGVVLSGYWTSPLDAGNTVLIVDYTHTSTTMSFITMPMGNNGGIKNLSIWYKNQNANDKYAFPWTIRAGGANSIENLTLINSYNGIYYEPLNAAVVRNVYGCALNQGFYASYSSELSWIYNVNFSSDYWKNAPDYVTNKPSGGILSNLISYLKTNFVGVQLGALDGNALYGVDASESKIGVYIKKDTALMRSIGETGRVQDNYGFGGVMSKINGTIIRHGWNATYWGIPVMNTDLIPELDSKQYNLAFVPATAKKDIFNVATYGAIGDSISNDTQAFMNAITAANSNGGGIVYFPKGRFRITEAIDIPSGVEVRGPIESAFVRIYVAWQDGCTLYFTYGKNTSNPDTDKALITLGANSGIRGLNIVLAEQTRQGVPYPYVIRGTGSGIWLENMLISNAYNLIDFASYACHNFVMSSLQCFGMKNGINIGGGTNGGKMEFITNTFGVSKNFKPATAEQTELEAYAYANSIGYRFGNCSNIETFGLTGFRPLTEMDFYSQNGYGCQNSSFWHCKFDQVNREVIRLAGNASPAFYGFWATGMGKNGQAVSPYNFIGSIGYTGHITIYNPALINTGGLSCINKSLNQSINKSNITLKFEQSLSTNKLATGTSLNGNTPSKALDDDVNTYWEANQGSEMVVDLGANYTIDRFSMLNAQLFDFDNSYNTETIQLSYSLNNIQYTACTSPTANVGWLRTFNNVEKKVFTDVPLDTVQARYVKLKVTNSNFHNTDTKVRIRSFDVFGIDKSSTLTTVSEIQMEDNQSVLVYSNKFTNAIYVKVSDALIGGSIDVYNMMGQKLHTSIIQSDETIIPVSCYGIKIIQIRKNQWVFNRKIN